MIALGILLVCVGGSLVVTLLTILRPIAWLGHVSPPVLVFQVLGLVLLAWLLADDGGDP